MIAKGGAKEVGDNRSGQGGKPGADLNKEIGVVSDHTNMPLNGSKVKENKGNGAEVSGHDPITDQDLLDAVANHYPQKPYRPPTDAFLSLVDQYIPKGGNNIRRRSDVSFCKRLPPCRRRKISRTTTSRAFGANISSHGPGAVSSSATHSRIRTLARSNFGMRAVAYQSTPTVAWRSCMARVGVIRRM
jgi:hypothetical protein